MTLAVLAALAAANLTLECHRSASKGHIAKDLVRNAKHSRLSRRMLKVAAAGIVCSCVDRLKVKSKEEFQ